MRIAFGLMIVPLFAAGACYRYVPATPAELAPGTEIRAHLSPEGIQRFGGPLNTEQIRLDGELLRWDQGGLAMEISADMHAAGFPATSLVQTLELSRDQIAEIERRELDGLRTAGFVAALAAGAVAAVLGTRRYGSGREDDPEGPGEEPRAGAWIRFPLVP